MSDGRGSCTGSNYCLIKKPKCWNHNNMCFFPVRKRILHTVHRNRCILRWVFITSQDTRFILLFKYLWVVTLTCNIIIIWTEVNQYWIPDTRYWTLKRWISIISWQGWSMIVNVECYASNILCAIIFTAHPKRNFLALPSRIRTVDC